MYNFAIDGVGVWVGRVEGNCSLLGVDSSLTRYGISHSTLMCYVTNDPLTLSLEFSHEFESSGI